MFITWQNRQYYCVETNTTQIMGAIGDETLELTGFALLAVRVVR
jgi:hypothetical protein